MTDTVRVAVFEAEPPTTFVMRARDDQDYYDVPAELVQAHEAASRSADEALQAILAHISANDLVEHPALAPWTPRVSGFTYAPEGGQGPGSFLAPEPTSTPSYEDLVLGTPPTTYINVGRQRPRMNPVPTSSQEQVAELLRECVIKEYRERPADDPVGSHLRQCPGLKVADLNAYDTTRPDEDCDADEDPEDRPYVQFETVLECPHDGRADFNWGTGGELRGLIAMLTPLNYVHYPKPAPPAPVYWPQTRLPADGKEPQ